MDKTMSFARPTVYGKELRSGVPAYDNNSGIRTVGAVIGTSKVYFGDLVITEDSAKNTVKVGNTGVIRGILLNQFAVNENMPVQKDYLFSGEPCSILYKGAVWVKDAATTAALNIGDAAKFDENGKLSATGTAVNNCKVVAVDEYSGEKYYLLSVTF